MLFVFCLVVPRVSLEFTATQWGVAIVVGKGLCEQLSLLHKGSMSNVGDQMSEVDCSASSSIVFISHLQSVLCFTLASYSYNCCVTLLQPGKRLSSS